MSETISEIIEEYAELSKEFNNVYGKFIQQEKLTANELEKEVVDIRECKEKYFQNEQKGKDFRYRFKKAIINLEFVNNDIVFSMQTRTFLLKILEELSLDDFITYAQKTTIQKMNSI